MAGDSTGFYADLEPFERFDDFVNRYDDPRYFVGAGMFFNDNDIASVASLGAVGNVGP